jgi:hypothetical protein
MSRRHRHLRPRRLRSVKLVLLSALAVGAIGSVTVRGVYGLLSAQSTNAGGSVATGTMTMANLNVGVIQTTLAATITSSQTTITVGSTLGFPSSGTYTIGVGKELMSVTGGQGTTTWTVTRGVNGTTAAGHSSGAIVVLQQDTVSASTTLTEKLGKNSLAANVPETTLTAAVTAAQTTITVASDTDFPASAPYTILVDSEQMTVTAGAGTTTWTVTRGVNSTTAAAHSQGTNVDPTTITVNSANNFPPSGNYQIQVDSEVMTVTAGQGTTTWTVTRGANGTAIASHASGTTVLTKTMFVNSASGFPASGDYTVDVGNEELLVTGGQGTTTWTVTRDVDGTSSANHGVNANVTTNQCQSYSGTGNANTGCDAVLTWAPDAESYPGVPATTTVAITDSGSVPISDLVVYMPSCLRDLTPDAPFAANIPPIKSFNSAGTTGGYLIGGTTYYYELTAVLPSGQTVAGPEATYTPPVGTNTNKITLHWTAIAGATQYDIYRSTSEGGEQLLDSATVNHYVDNTSTTPSGSPPSGTGSGNPCLPPNPPVASDDAELTIQETTPGAIRCWYPSNGETCAFDSTENLGVFAEDADTFGTGIDLGAGPAALDTRYFQIGIEFPSGASNAYQGTEADFTLHWYAVS